MFKAAKFDDDFTTLPQKEIIDLDAAVCSQFEQLPYGPFMAVKMMAGEKTALLLSDKDHRQIVRPESYRNFSIISTPSSTTSPTKRRHEEIDVEILSD